MIRRFRANPIATGISQLRECTPKPSAREAYAAVHETPARPKQRGRRLSQSTVSCDQTVPHGSYHSALVQKGEQTAFELCSGHSSAGNRGRFAVNPRRAERSALCPTERFLNRPLPRQPTCASTRKNGVSARPCSGLEWPPIARTTGQTARNTDSRRSPRGDVARTLRSNLCLMRTSK